MGGPVSFPILLQWDSAHPTDTGREGTWEGFTVGVSYTVNALTGTAVKSDWAVI